MLTRVTATRYVAALREGGSLPGLVEADDLGTYVVKFRGAGQGRKALVAEVIAGELARRLDLPVPELVLVDLDPELSRAEPDEEVQDLLRASAGLNLGVDFLPGALGYDGLGWRPDAELAARVVWFDALVSNADRSWRNPNLLVWHRRLWLIDHGATLWFHHSWPNGVAGGRGAGTPAGAGDRSGDGAATRPYDASEHALTGLVGDLRGADAALAPRVTTALLREVVDLVPDEWLVDDPGNDDPDAVRAAYVEHLLRRVSAPRDWLGVAA
ncbi:MAG TPA: HipA family kinase [Actinomycetes bacterium]|nr:HipA family kinase [Actinomycetes bacterium]